MQNGPKAVHDLHLMQKISWQLLIVYTIWLGTVFLGAPALAAPGSARQVVPAQHSGTHREWTPTGRLAATNQLNFAIALPLRNTVSLTNLLHEIYNPASTNYHRYLTPAQFAAQFGPSAADYAAVQAFARAQGWHIAATHPNRLLLDVSGAVPDVERALHVRMQTYQHPTEPRRFFAPDAEPSLDLATPILGISGLDNYARPQPHVATQTLITNLNNAVPNAGSGPNGSFLGDDFRSAYLPNVTLTGTGQTVGLLQFDGYTPADITYYESKTGRAAVPLRNVLLDGFNGAPTGNGGEVEVALDIEMALSMAPGLSQIIVYMAGPSGNWHDILNRMATDNLARQLSCSWYIPGGAADPIADIIFQQMALQGQTFFTASGDYDAYTGPINFPNASPYITQVGGTTLTTTGTNGARVSETTWNRNNGIGTGGGIATEYPIPSWQTNVDMSRNQGSTTWRNIPDVALTAENVYVRANLQDYRVGGTSCASPLWAAVAALVNQQAAAVGQPPIGFINPALDAIGTGPSYSLAFNDITTGNNASPISPARFSATNGYDLCTGWGTPNGQNLINALANPEPLLISPLAGFSAAGAAGGPFTTAAQTFTLTNGGTNSLTWSLANTSLWLSASATSGTLLPGGPAATVTMSLNAAASNLVVGLYPATLWFTNGTDASGQSRAFSLSVIPPPVIVTPLTNVIALAGSTAVFNLNVTGGQPLACQWQLNGSNLTDLGTISGTTTTNLVLASVQPSQAGSYSVIITNAAGAVTSAPARLTIPASAPVFVLQPTNQTLFVHQTAQFAVTVVGSTPYTYQWTCNTTNLPGATNATLTLGNLQLAQSGNYAVQVSNAYGSTNSLAAVLTVNPPPPCAPVLSGMADWWPGEGNANDTVGVNQGTLVGGVSFAPGEVGQAFLFDGSSGYVSIPDSPSLDSFVTNITIELWLKVNQTTPNSDWRGIVTKGNSSWRLQGVQGANTVNFAANGVSTSLTGSRNINDGVWHHVGAVYDGAKIYLYVDGTLDSSATATGSISQNSYPVCLGQNPEAPHPYYFNGLIDEVSLYHRALTANEIALIYYAGTGGKCPLPLAIMAQPANETVTAGSSANLNVVASGPAPLFYQWTFNGTNLVGATNSTLLIPSVQVTDAGVYAVIVSNNYDSVVSSNAVLTVITQPPIITTQPASQTNFAGYSASFTVAASGSQPLSYQWTFNTTNLVGATNATLSLTNLQLVQSGTYAVQVSNAYGLANSANALLTVSAVPPCTPAPSGLADWWTAESNANDSVGLNNGTLVGGVTYAHGKVGQAFLFDGSSGYVSIPDSPSLDSFITNITIETWIKVNQTTPNSDWQGIVTKGNSSWRLQGVQGAGTVNFAANGLSSDLTGTRNVNDGNWHHVAAVYDGTNILLYVDGTLDKSASSSGSIVQNSDPVYLGANPEALHQYYFNGSIDEVSIYDRPLKPVEIMNIYLAGMYGKCPAQLAITTQPTNQIVYANASANFVVVATGPQPLLYQWTFNGNAILGATNNLLNLTNVQPFNAGTYSVTISNIFSSLTSSNAFLTVISQPPVITSQPINQTNYAGESVAFTVVADGAQPLNYQWSFNLFNIADATNSTLTLTNIQVGQAGSYSVQVSNAYGNTISRPAILVVNAIPPCTPVSAGLLDWWAAENNLYDNIGTNNGILNGGARFTSGEVGQALSFDGLSGYVNVPESLSLDLFLTNITVELWININPQSPNQNWRSIISKGNSSWRLQLVPGTGFVNFAANGLTSDLTSTHSLNDGKWHHLAAVYNSTNISIYIDGILDASKFSTGLIAQNKNPIYLGASPEAPSAYYFTGLIDELSLYNSPLSLSQIESIYLAGRNGKCSEPITITIQPTNQTILAGENLILLVDAVGQQPIKYQWAFNGNNIDGGTNNVLILTNVQPTSSGIYSVTVSNQFGKITSSNAIVSVLSEPPFITIQPISKTNYELSSAIFNVTAGGSKPLSYQWNFNSKIIPGETNATLSLTNLQLLQAGNYFVQVSNGYGITNSAIAVLTVNSLPSCASIFSGMIAWWAAEGNACDDIGLNGGTLVGGASYSPGEVGQAFFLDGSSGYVNIPSSPSLNSFVTNITIELWLKVNQTTPNADWRGIVTKGNSSWRLQGTSGANTINFAANGVSVNLSGNKNINDEKWHHVAAVYDGTSIYLYVDGALDASAPATGLISQTSDPVSLGNNVGVYNAYYFNGFIDEVGLYNRPLSASEIQQIYLAGTNGICLLPVAINSQPGNQTVNAGTNATLSVVATGSQPINYQWTLNGTNLAGATNSVLTLASVQLPNAGPYAVTVANAVNSVTSSNAVLTVLFQSPSILIQPVSQTNVAGTTASFSITPAGSPPLFYQWNCAGTNLVGATNATLTLPNVLPSQAGLYSVTVSNLYGAATSSNASLTIIALPPSLLSQPMGLTNYVGTTASFSVTASGSPVLSYQWTLNTTNLVGATNATLNLTNLQPDQAGNYAVQVANPYGLTNSAAAPLTVLIPSTNIPVITAFSPIMGAVGTPVTITGTNFSPSAANNAVYFGSVRAVVQAASPTSLVVAAPSGAVYAPITVTVAGLTAYAPAPFLSTYPGSGTITSSTLALALTLPSTGTVGSVVIADLDGDGKPDLAVNTGSGVISLYRNLSTNGVLGSGSFAARVDMPVGTSGPYGLVAADLDGDGKLDLVAVDTSYNRVMVLRNLSTPGSLTTNSFAARVNFTVGTGPRGLAVRDLDGDGKPDILVANYNSGTVSVLRNLGNPGGLTVNSFAPAVNFATGSLPQNTTIADVDGDGKPDVVTVNYGSSVNALSVLRNVSTPGSLAFTANVTFSGLTTSYALAVGDLDGDGKPDVLVGSQSGGAISVFRNISTPGAITASSFASRVDFNSANGAYALALGDISGSGKPDVAQGSSLSSLIYLFQNKSTPGSFTNTSLAARLGFSANLNMGAVTIGDLDGDGQPEVVGGSLSYATLSILHNVGSSAPFIRSQPLSATNFPMTTASFTATAGGTVPLHYQWRLNGTNLPGANDATLVLTNVQSSQAGNYALWVTNLYGSILSSNAALVITPLYHFVWNVIPSPRFVNTPFAVVIQAQNLTNGLATNFTSAVNLQATNGIPITPSVINRFNQGIWNGTVTVAQTATNLVLAASDAAGDYGLANPVNLVNLPTLTTVVSSGTLLLYWPISPAGFSLETTPDLTLSNWLHVTTPPFQIGNQYILPLPMAGTNAYYRLRIPEQ